MGEDGGNGARTGASAVPTIHDELDVVWFMYLSNLLQARFLMGLLLVEKWKIEPTSQRIRRSIIDD